MHCVKIIRSAREKVTHFLPLDYKMHKQETRDQPEECAILYTTAILKQIFTESVITNKPGFCPSLQTCSKDFVYAKAWLEI